MAAITVEPAPLADQAWGSRPRLQLVPEASSPRRADVVLVCVAALAALLAFAYLAFGPADPVADGVPVSAEVHVVEPGDSMWSIATERAPAGTAAAYVERLVAVNGTAVVEIGQEVVLPVG